MAISITGHKAQGMTIAKDESFEKAVLRFPTSVSKKITVGFEYVMTGRSRTLTDFAISNKIASLDRSKLLKIRSMPNDVEPREFQQMVKERYERVDCPRVKVEIAAVDTAEVKTHEDGYCFLRK